MKRALFLFCLLIIGFRSLYAQNIEFKASNFPGKKAELEQAKENLKQGQNCYSNELFRKANEFFLKAYSFNTNNAELNYQIGMCYYFTGMKSRSLPYFEKSQSLLTDKTGEIKYYLAIAYQYNLEFDKAINEYNDYKKTLSKKALAAESADIDKKITECTIAKEFVNTPRKNIVITNLGNEINSEYSEYTPLVSDDGTKMFLTLQGDDTVAKDPTKPQVDEFIYTSGKTDGHWSKPVLAKSPFNKNLFCSIVAMEQKKNALVVYKGEKGGDLYETQYDGKKYSPFVSLGPKINTKYQESSASITADGQTMYFASDRPGGNGGSDIYVSQLDNKGKWGTPKNIGTAINTPFDEDGVCISADGKTLYFSSKGHKNMGEFDVFKSVNVDGNWCQAENMGYPINTPGNDIYFQISPDEKSAYYASERPEGYGGEDIYLVKFVEEKPVLADTFAKVDTNRYAVMKQKLDSAGFKDFYARVQIGAFYKKNIADFKNAYPSLKSQAIYMESVRTGKKKILRKFMLNQKFSTIKEAETAQMEMWNVHKIADAFVAIYNKKNERVAIYNTKKKEFVILKGDKKLIYF